MKITNEQLKRIIKEELELAITEMDSNDVDNLRPELRDEFRGLPNEGGTIMGSPGAMARDELIDIAGALDDAEYLSQLAKTVQSDEAIRVLEKLGHM